MNIQFAGPLAKVLGHKRWVIRSGGQLTAEEVIVRLAHDFPQAEVFREVRRGKPPIPYMFMVIKNGKSLLRPHDRLDDQDELEIIPPIMGG
ncbi:thiamineS protein [Thermosinus carboxydivorans Nor1]|uniref:ThiamineS protein n=1 Tax=Thermosinus carboxydivorans Nor1 TaxID=401526 RepID=A1HP76_9FIRM|nr:MoaD/ThiS family protein [Thermosinus carboxydivorans]EAX48184.1 thiamineS protein [Thermosinus carboxydivorans Nor1]